MTAAIVVLVAWGVGSFGAVYPWAYGPLLAGAGATGVWGLVTVPNDLGISRGMWIALTLVGVAIFIQVLPLPLTVLQALSPETDSMLRRYSLRYAGMPGPHALSIAPEKSLLGLGFFACLALFLGGASRHLSRHGVEQLATALVGVGLIVALVGIVQRASRVDGRIYGFWTPQARGDMFGPFVNKNHFAGWMLMSVPIAIGSFIGRVATDDRSFRTGWRNRLVWFSSPEANALLLIATATSIMMLSLLLTLSRSGLTAFAISVVLALALTLRSHAGFWRKALAAAGLLLVAWTAVSWAGIDRLTDQFSGVHNSAPARVAVWRSALHIVSRYPIAGTGFNTFGIATVFYPTPSVDLHFVEAHNDYLQIAAEGGVLVAIPAAVALALFVREIWRRFHEGGDSEQVWWVRAGAVLGLIAIALQELVDFSLQIPGNAILFAALCAIAIHRPPARR